MKNFLAIIGGIAAIIFLALVAVFIFIGVRLGPLEKEAETYVRETILAIATDWDGDELLARATPEMAETLANGALEEFLGNSSRTIGALVSLSDITCSANMSVTTAAGEVANAECTTSGEHERGTADYRVVVVKRDDVWKLHGFFITPYFEERGPVPV